MLEVPSLCLIEFKKPLWKEMQLPFFLLDLYGKQNTHEKGKTIYTICHSVHIYTKISNSQIA
jgi:hypothetical protein